MTSATRARPSASASRRVVSPTVTTVLSGDALIGRRPDPWEQAIADLSAFSHLRDDWDGLGAKAPSGALLRSATHIVEILRAGGYTPPSRVTVTVNGTVAFEWQAGGAYEEMEIVQSYQAELMRLSPGEPSRHWQLSAEDFEYLAKSFPK